MKHWPHAPPHHLGANGTYMVTASTYQRIHYFKGEENLTYLQTLLLEALAENNWNTEAWCVFPNHYHFIAQAPLNRSSELTQVIRKIHSLSARHINEQNNSRGQKIWHNYRDTIIDNEKSHLARLHYVHANAVHHDLVNTPTEYPYGSARWLQKTDTAARLNTIYSFPCDKLLKNDIPL